MNKISVQQFCLHHDIPQSFIDTLYTFELIELIETKEEKYIQVDSIDRLESLMRIHYDLNVNMEGLDIINNLMSQIQSLKNEVEDLNRRLNFYEE